MAFFSSTAQLPGPGTYSIEVVGESHYQAALAAICGGPTEEGADCIVEATLVHEDDNPYDNQAIRVDIQGKTVGYLSRTNARQFRAKLKEAGYPGITATCSARIRGGWDRGVDDRGYFGVRLDLPTATDVPTQGHFGSNDNERKRSALESAEERQRADYEVESYESALKNLLSLHKDCRPQIDWQMLATSPQPPKPAKPTKPQPDHYYEEKARKALADYTPSVLDRVLFRADRKRRELEEAIQRGEEKDRRSYSATCEQLSVRWRQQLAESQQHIKDWQAITKLAGGVVNRDTRAFAEAIERMNGFAGIRQLGVGLKFKFSEAVAEVTAQLRGDDAMLSESKALTKTGKLSTKKLSASKRMEMFRIHVCSCVIHVARETLALMPVEVSVVTAVVERRNVRTGHDENTPILSVAVPRTICQRIKWAKVEALDAIENFYHRVRFKRAKGFEPIDPIQWGDLPEVGR
jgi:hypothetical protein